MKDSFSGNGKHKSDNSANEIEEFVLLDSGRCRKLEKVGKYTLIRPTLNAFWSPTLPESEWAKADAIFERDSTGGGMWLKGKKRERNFSVDESWNVSWGGVNLFIKPTQFGHVGFFAEQIHNWQWLRECVREIGKDATTLNLFAYSGGATIAMAQGGANVCHLDSSKGVIEWAKRNQDLNPGIEDKIRWICDDAMKFVSREERRGRKYNGIVLDPPSFGRGSQGQVWKIEDDIAGLLQSCRKIIDTENAFFILLSCHSQGFTPYSLGRCLAEVFPEFDSSLETGEMLIPEATGRSLPAGIYARIFAKPKKG